MTRYTPIYHFHATNVLRDTDHNSFLFLWLRTFAGVEITDWHWLMARGRVRGRVIVSLFSREYHHWAAPRKELRLQSGGVCRPRARPAGQCQAQLWTGHSELETRSYNHALWVRADNIESRSLNLIVIVKTILIFYEDSRQFVSLLEKNLISCISNDCVILS